MVDEAKAISYQYPYRVNSARNEDKNARTEVDEMPIILLLYVHHEW